MASMALAAASRRVLCSASKAAAASLMSSARRAFSSTSAVVCRPVTGSHVMRVDGYSHLRRVLRNGDMVSSAAFDVGGHSWCLDVYPNGHKTSKLKRYIAVFLRLQSDPSFDERVWALPKLSLLHPFVEPWAVAEAERSLCFEGTGYAWGFPEYMDKHELEKSEYLKDDSFAIQCDVTVTTAILETDYDVFSS